MMLTFGLQVSRWSAGWASIITINRSFVGRRPGKDLRVKSGRFSEDTIMVLINFSSVGRSKWVSGDS
jgi:hypothetical protein